MDKLDLRKKSDVEIKLIREQIIRHKKLGLSGKDIEELIGVNQSYISRIWQSYQREGCTALQPQKSGRKKDSCMLLTKSQENEIKRIIIDKTPDQVKLSFMLWTREAISQLAQRLFGVTLSLRTVTNYLKRWGFTCQRPTKRAYSQDNIRIDRFMKEEYPRIAKRAKEEKAAIYWGDETGISNQENYQRGFAPKGQPPVLLYETKRERLNILSAITNQGKVRFMIFEGTMTQQRLIDFMRRMVRDVTSKVFLILDNLKVHHGKKVKAWIEKHKDRIELFFLPPYAPEYNPDEYLNHALKRDVHSGLKPRTKAGLRSKSESFLRGLQHDSRKVKAFFKHKSVVYAK
jgi:transposase